MRIVATTILLATLIFAGCTKQAQQGTPNAAPSAVAQTPAPMTASNAPATAQKGTPVVVFSTPGSAAKPVLTPNLNQAAGVEANGWLDLPQADQTVVLDAPARTALGGALATARGDGPVALPDDTTAAVMDSIGGEFRSSCNAVVANWGANRIGSARWTVQILFSSRGSEGTKAVLSIRCSTTMAGDENIYDERPAIVSITSNAATLRLIPLAATGRGEETLYRLNFSQVFAAVNARLVELGVYHSTGDNPCCGGADEESGYQRMILDLTTGKQALQIDERTVTDSHDDSEEDADSQVVCDAKFVYSRDGAGNVEGIATETRCTENKKPQPEVKKQMFAWNAEAHQFVPVK